MTFYDYLLLKEAEKIERVLSTGVYLTGRENRENCILLYQVDAFYVELHYCMETDSLTKLLPFTHTERLGPYLAKIDISELINN